MKKKKTRKALNDLISRSDYLVVQGNDLAKAFGNLKAFEHKLLDYCFSCVTKESRADDKFKVNSNEILKYFSLNSSGQNYMRVALGFKSLNENTALYFAKNRPDGKKSVVMSQLFSYIEFVEDGGVEFKFSEVAQPYVFELKKNFYSFHLRELANIKGKYAIILLKLWESNRYGNRKITFISGTLEEWQEWFLGSDRRMTAGYFGRDVISRAVEELEAKFPIEITLEVLKSKRKVTGYEMEIVDKRTETTNDFYRAVEASLDANEYQTSIYDYLD